MDGPTIDATRQMRDSLREIQQTPMDSIKTPQVTTLVSRILGGDRDRLDTLSAFQSMI
ncbi:hypothetical protein Rhe02_41050 [Rhizocola hellebori]|uniref:Uncharacterized protein n=1 Tax=Rhizocola hellebori TaxID=1392758 RepID=A0A8J3QA95_9ACTN|nr:hypothetical protein Rhe02_41050 [Rhizocola hellebori]